jgi:hypothetical protein
MLFCVLSVAVGLALDSQPHLISTLFPQRIPVNAGILPLLVGLEF